MRFDRITAKSDQMGGVPCIRGVRIAVATVVWLVAQGMTTGEILVQYPDLEPEDIEQSLRYAAIAVNEYDGRGLFAEICH